MTKSDRRYRAMARTNGAKVEVCNWLQIDPFHRAEYKPVGSDARLQLEFDESGMESRKLVTRSKSGLFRASSQIREGQIDVPSARPGRLRIVDQACTQGEFRNFVGGAYAPAHR